MRVVLVTGNMGLVGARLVALARMAGWSLAGLDLRAPGLQRGDVRKPEDIARAMGDCIGIVHLAAVSRVIWGEQDPALCWATNVDGTRTILECALVASQRPWFVYASSREVYGEPRRLPVTEDASLAPINAYGRSKLAGERLVEDACRAGLRTSIVRLSNVYGSVEDHDDRVVPAFVRAALQGKQLRVDGAANTFDFTHVDDAARGIIAIMEALDCGRAPPPLHLLTGYPTSLGELAATTVQLAGSRSKIMEAPSRSFDVARFYGDPKRAVEILGWRASISLREGLARLIADYRAGAALR